MKKRLTCIVIGLAMLLLAAGCGDIVLPTGIPEETLGGADTTVVIYPLLETE